jgi:PleD family two-component response regulator
MRSSGVVAALAAPNMAALLEKADSALYAANATGA